MAAELLPLDRQSLEVLEPFMPRDDAEWPENRRAFFTVLEGSVRSSKTLTSLLAWLLYVLYSPENTFLMLGFTTGSLVRNCLDNDYGLLNLARMIAGITPTFKTDANGQKFLDIAGKHCYYMGAGTEASYKTFRGLTIGGCYFDEISKHHKNSIVEALNRSAVSRDRCNFATLNPEAPAHWIYRDFIDRYADESLPGYRWFHFTLRNNPRMTPERIAELSAQYTGVFYKRDILGLRVRAEGACFPSFVHNAEGEDGNVLYKVPQGVKFASIGADIGGDKSATTNACVGFFHNDAGELCGVLLDEMYDTQNKSTESIIANFKAFVLRCRARWPVAGARSDSAEQLIKKSYSNLGVVNVYDSLKKPIVDRIRFFDLAYSLRRFFVMSNCTATIEAIESAVWDERSIEPRRLDDGSTNIDSLDALEYAVEEYFTDFGFLM